MGTLIPLSSPVLKSKKYTVPTDTGTWEITGWSGETPGPEVVHAAQSGMLPGVSVRNISDDSLDYIGGGQGLLHEAGDKLEEYLPDTEKWNAFHFLPEIADPSYWTDKGAQAIQNKPVTTPRIDPIREGLSHFADENPSIAAPLQTLAGLQTPEGARNAGATLVAGSGANAHSLLGDPVNLALMATGVGAEAAEARSFNTARKLLSASQLGASGLMGAEGVKSGLQGHPMGWVQAALGAAGGRHAINREYSQARGFDVKPLDNVKPPNVDDINSSGQFDPKSLPDIQTPELGPGRYVPERDIFDIFKGLGTVGDTPQSQRADKAPGTQINAGFDPSKVGHNVISFIRDQLKQPDLPTPYKGKITNPGDELALRLATASEDDAARLWSDVFDKKSNKFGSKSSGDLNDPFGSKTRADPGDTLEYGRKLKEAIEASFTPQERAQLGLPELTDEQLLALEQNAPDANMAGGELVKDSVNDVVQSPNQVPGEVPRVIAPSSEPINPPSTETIPPPTPGEVKVLSPAELEAAKKFVSERSAVTQAELVQLNKRFNQPEAMNELRNELKSDPSSQFVSDPSLTVDRTQPFQEIPNTGNKTHPLHGILKEIDRGGKGKVTNFKFKNPLDKYLAALDNAGRTNQTRRVKVDLTEARKALAQHIAAQTGMKPGHVLVEAVKLGKYMDQVHAIGTGHGKVYEVPSNWHEGVEGNVVGKRAYTPRGQKGLKDTVTIPPPDPTPADLESQLRDSLDPNKPVEVDPIIDEITPETPVTPEPITLPGEVVPDEVPPSEPTVSKHYGDAIKLAVDNGGRIGSSMLQRQFKIGFTEASNILDKLREQGHATIPEVPKPTEPTSAPILRVETKPTEPALPEEFGIEDVDTNPPEIADITPKQSPISALAKKIGTPDVTKPGEVVFGEKGKSKGKPKPPGVQGPEIPKISFGDARRILKGTKLTGEQEARLVSAKGDPRRLFDLVNEIQGKIPPAVDEVASKKAATENFVPEESGIDEVSGDASKPPSRFGPGQPLNPFTIGKNLLDTGRGLLTGTADLSWSMNQGLNRLFVDPVGWSKTLGKQARAFVSKKYADAETVKLHNDPQWQQLQDEGLHTSGGKENPDEIHSILGGGYLKQLPITKRIFGATERSYNLARNTDRLYWAKRGENPMSKDRINFANKISGSGNLPDWMKSAEPVLDNIAFAPRYRSAQLHQMNPLNLVSKNVKYPFTDKAIGKYAGSELGDLWKVRAGKLAAAGLGTYALSKMRHKDDEQAGHVSIGHGSHDLSAGEAGQWKDIGRLLGGDDYGKEVTGGFYPWEKDRWDVAGNILRKNLNILPGAIVDRLSHKDVTGLPVDRGIQSGPLKGGADILGSGYGMGYLSSRISPITLQTIAAILGNPDDSKAADTTNTLLSPVSNARISVSPEARAKMNAESRLLAENAEKEKKKRAAKKGKGKEDKPRNMAPKKFTRSTS